MGDRVAIIWPRYVQSVGAMRDQHTRVAAWCPECKTMFKLDLEAIIHQRGRSYSLIDQRGPCRRYGCDGKASFMFSPGAGVPFRPLSTDRGDAARSDRARLSDGDDEPPLPPAPQGVSPDAWSKADERERKRLVRRARG